MILELMRIIWFSIILIGTMWALITVVTDANDKDCELRNKIKIGMLITEFVMLTVYCWF